MKSQGLTRLCETKFVGFPQFSFYAFLPTFYSNPFFFNLGSWAAFLTPVIFFLSNSLVIHND